VSTGEFLVAQIDGHIDRTLNDELIRMNPAEVIVPDSIDDTTLDALRQRFHALAFTKRPEDEFDHELAEDRVCDRYSLGTLKGIGLEDAPEALGCVGAVIQYVAATQRDSAPHLRLPRCYSPAGYVVLDGATQRNLELVESLADKRKKGSLLGVLDKTLTSMGSRKLRQWILHPLLEPAAIRARLQAVEEFLHDTEIRLELRELLRGIADLERLMGRITAKTGNGRDLKALGRSLAHAPNLQALLSRAEGPMLQALKDQVDRLDDVTGWIDAQIVDDPRIPSPKAT
jgi:DNA mismatch repair protein MutS